MKYFFILGCPRSGTTMLQQALNRHSRIAIPPETKFFFSFFGHSKAAQQEHLDRLERDLDIDLPDLDERISTDEDARRFFQNMAVRYLDRLERRDVSHFGEKTPEHTGQVRKIMRVFPTAKLIFLHRDGRDVALSLSKVPWMDKDLYVNFTIWRYYERILWSFPTEECTSVLHVKYEELVTQPPRECERILDFLGLRNERAVAHGYGNSEGIPGREYGWKAAALQSTRQL